MSHSGDILGRGRDARELDVPPAAEIGRLEATHQLRRSPWVEWIDQHTDAVETEALLTLCTRVMRVDRGGASW